MSTGTVDGRVEQRPSPSKLAHGLRLNRPFTPRELVVALVALSVLSALVFAPHLQHGGYYLDDWSNAVMSLRPPGSFDLGGALSAYADITIYRPVLVVYVPLTYLVFGMHMHYHLVWTVALAVLAVTMFYGVLRTLGVPWIHALLIAFLAMVFPWSDSTRLWVTGGQVTLSITFAVAGILVALVGLKRRSWRWHACALVLYLLSILSYEVTLPLIACVGVLYCLRVGWRAARSRWLADGAVVVAAGIWVSTHTSRAASGLSGNLDHLKLIVEQGGTIVGRAALPLGSPRTAAVLLAVAVVLGAGTIAYLSFPDRFAAKRGWGLREWLLLAGGGLVVTALGWVAFIPADPYYTPTIFGETNRVNGLATFGLVPLLYGAFGVIGTLAGQIRPQARWIAASVTVLLAMVLLASYTHVLRRHIEIWDLAYAAERTAITKVQERMPQLPRGTTVFASAYPANQTLGVPILAARWDFKSMLRMEYDDSTLTGYPVLAERRIGCRAGGVTLEKGGRPEVTAPYGTVRLLNLQDGSYAAPRSRNECRRVAHHHVPGPLYLSGTY